MNSPFGLSDRTGYSFKAAPDAAYGRRFGAPMRLFAKAKPVTR